MYDRSWVELSDAKNRSRAIFIWIPIINTANYNYSKLILTFRSFFAGGRRGIISLGHILKFVTGDDQEPILGYELDPSLIFDECDDGRFLPSARTCISQLVLPRATINVKLPEENSLFNLYDFAFANDYFGKSWTIDVIVVFFGLLWLFIW